MAQRLYTRADVECNTDRALVILHNKVYDVTEWLATFHPELASAFPGGGDASDCLEDPEFANIARLWQRNFLIGELVSDDRAIYRQMKNGELSMIYFDYTLEEHKDTPLLRNVESLGKQLEIGCFEWEVLTSSGLIFDMREESPDILLDVDFPLEIKMFPEPKTQNRAM